MSTKGTIADVTTDGMFVHVYTECFDSHPQPVYIEMWEQGEQTNLSMTVVMSQENALSLAEAMTKWAASVRENNARLAGKEQP